MKIRATLLALSMTFATAAFAGDRGYFGFDLAVDSEGFFLNPTVRSIRINKVLPDSPAAKAGIAAGDDVLEVAGLVVAGAKGRELMALAQKEVGESLRVKVKHAGGELASVTMIAVAKPGPAK